MPFFNWGFFGGEIRTTAPSPGWILKLHSTEHLEHPEAENWSGKSEQKRHWSVWGMRLDAAEEAEERSMRALLHYVAFKDQQIQIETHEHSSNSKAFKKTKVRTLVMISLSLSKHMAQVKKNKQVNKTFGTKCTGMQKWHFSLTVYNKLFFRVTVSKHKSVCCAKIKVN